MTPIEVAWVAGVLEGEGSFLAKKNSSVRKSTGQKYVYPVIECNMCDEDIIRRLHAVTGVGRVTGPYGNKNKTGWTPVWRYTVQKTNDALQLMTELLPWMGLRRSARINELLAQFDTAEQGVAVM